MHALHLERNLTEHYDLSALRSPVGLEQLIHTGSSNNRFASLLLLFIDRIALLFRTYGC